MEKTTLYLPEELLETYRALARRLGTSQAELMRTALAEYAERTERSRLKFLGVAASGEVHAVDAEDWLAENWRPDW